MIVFTLKLNWTTSVNITKYIQAYMFDFIPILIIKFPQSILRMVIYTENFLSLNKSVSHPS